LLSVDDAQARELEKRILNRDRSIIPGTVRVSFGIYNTKEEVEVLCEALHAIAAGKVMEGYVLDKERGEYTRPDMEDRFKDVLKL
jgi:hypothetical protein